MLRKIYNPIVRGHYADPEARYYQGKYWIYATQSRPFSEQKKLTAFSSEDLIKWTKHDNILDMCDFPWIWGAVWAPTIIERNGLYYLMFSSNDIHSNSEPGGIEVAVSDSPAGPFKGYLGRPLIGEFINGAQPIDAHLFKDDDGTVYLYFGGWGHCNIAIMNETMDGFLPFPDGQLMKEITPPGYMEGPCMIKHNGIYYFLWSTGSWEGNDYGVLYGTSNSPLGPFAAEGRVLESKEALAESPGHNGYLYHKEYDQYLIVYHRRDYGSHDIHSRKLCIDVMNLKNGVIDPVLMTGFSL